MMLEELDTCPGMAFVSRAGAGRRLLASMDGQPSSLCFRYADTMKLSMHDKP